MVSTDGKVLVSDAGIKIGSNCGQYIGTILGDVDGITLGFDVGTDMSYFYLSFNGYDYVNL